MKGHWDFKYLVAFLVENNDLRHVENFRSEDDWSVIFWRQNWRQAWTWKLLETDEIEFVCVLGCESKIVELDFPVR